MASTLHQQPSGGAGEHTLHHHGPCGGLTVCLAGKRHLSCIPAFLAALSCVHWHPYSLMSQKGPFDAGSTDWALYTDILLQLDDGLPGLVTHADTGTGMLTVVRGEWGQVGLRSGAPHVMIAAHPPCSPFVQSVPSNRQISQALTRPPCRCRPSGRRQGVSAGPSAPAAQHAWQFSQTLAALCQRHRACVPHRWGLPWPHWLHRPTDGH